MEKKQNTCEESSCQLQIVSVPIKRPPPPQLKFSPASLPCELPQNIESVTNKRISILNFNSSVLLKSQPKLLRDANHKQEINTQLTAIPFTQTDEAEGLEGAFDEEDLTVTQDLPEDVKQAFKQSGNVILSVDKSLKDRQGKGRIIQKGLAKEACEFINTTETLLASEYSFELTKDYKLEKDLKRKQKKEEKANGGNAQQEPNGLINYYTGHVDGLKKYLKGLPQFQKRQRLVDDEVDKFEQKKVEHKRIILRFSKPSQKCYKLTENQANQPGFPKPSTKPLNKLISQKMDMQHTINQQTSKVLQGLTEKYVKLSEIVGWSRLGDLNYTLSETSHQIRSQIAEQAERNRNRMQEEAIRRDKLQKEHYAQIAAQRRKSIENQRTKQKKIDQTNIAKTLKLEPPEFFYQTSPSYQPEVNYHTESCYIQAIPAQNPRSRHFSTTEDDQDSARIRIVKSFNSETYKAQKSSGSVLASSTSQQNLADELQSSSDRKTTLPAIVKNSFSRQFVLFNSDIRSSQKNQAQTTILPLASEQVNPFLHNGLVVSLDKKTRLAPNLKIANTSKRNDMRKATQNVQLLKEYLNVYQNSIEESKSQSLPQLNMSKDFLPVKTTRIFSQAVHLNNLARMNINTGITIDQSLSKYMTPEDSNYLQKQRQRVTQITSRIKVLNDRSKLRKALTNTVQRQQERTNMWQQKLALDLL